MNVRLFTSTHVWCGLAAELVKRHFPGSVEIVRSAKGDQFPSTIGHERASCAISFLYPIIIPGEVLEASDVAVNFHPGSRNYPGYGPYNFALYENAAEYGALYHHMGARVDTGKIIEEDVFQVFPWDTVETLQLRSYASLIALLNRFLARLTAGDDFTAADIDWTREPFTRMQLDELSIVTADLSREEAARRIKATDYPGFPPTITRSDMAPIEDAPGRRPLAFQIFERDK